MKHTQACWECGEVFAAPRSAARKYCSRTCYEAVASRRTREQAVGWRSGVSLSGHGYRLILVGKQHPMANNNGYVPEHRLVMAEHLGRMLDRTEHVHHRNGDRLDNRLENLELLPIAQHTRLHNTGKNRSLVRWSRQHDACVSCGTSSRKHNARGLCVNCYMQQRR